jgi:tRNA-Thr(GGU) m(6)t(6)A37 methyltransferase TsaA
MGSPHYTIEPIGFVRSALRRLEDAPMQGDEGAPEAWLELTPQAAQGLLGIQPGNELIVLTWLHLAQRDVLQVHPRGDINRPLTGVFATRSPDRPNPIGLHRVSVLEVVDAQRKLRVVPLEAINGTPIVDIKPVLSGTNPSDR